jgi:tRNA A37 methylthiotransferase MiaB
VAVGCLAERYGSELERALPEVDAVLGFDTYTELSGHLAAVLQGHRPTAHVPRDRRTLLPLAPAARAAAAAAAGGVASSAVVEAAVPAPAVAPPSDVDVVRPSTGQASGVPVVRRRLDGRPWAPLKLATGCDRRCAFCAIPRFRGAFTSRRPEEVLAEAAWLAGQGVREAFLVSENSTSYGKDLGDLRLLETLLPRLAAVPGLHRVRVSYLQPAEVRPGLIEAIAGTPRVAPYFDLSFQHSSPAVLRRMRRFGGTGEFLALIERIRSLAPTAGIRSNVIVGFPGETEADLADLEAFLTDAMLDVVGVFGYSDEEGTEAAGLSGKLDADVIAARVARVGDLVEQLTAQRALDRVGETVEVLVEGLDEDEGHAVGRAAHQGPDVDGVTLLPEPSVLSASSSSPPSTADAAHPNSASLRPGDVVRARVVGAEGVDLVAAAEAVLSRGSEPVG